MGFSARALLGSLVCALFLAPRDADARRSSLLGPPVRRGGGQNERLIKADAMLDSLRLQGGMYGFDIGQPCPTCARGLIATRDYKENETIARVILSPSVAVDLGPSDSWEMPYTLANRVNTDPDFNSTLGLFWETQPSQEQEIFTLETFTEEYIDMLQSEEMATIINSHIEHHKLIYEEKKEQDTNFNVTWDKYLHFASLATSRTFTVPDDPNNEDTTWRTWLIPAIDMINSRPPFNVHRVDAAAGILELRALHAIKEGEELTTYYNSRAHRNDVSLLLYGFVMEHDEPILCLIDQNGYSLEEPWEDTEQYADFLYSLPRGASLELERLKARLASIHTTEEEDRTMLAEVMKADPDKRDWRKEMILKFRIERKRAISYRINQIEEELGEL